MHQNYSPLSAKLHKPFHGFHRPLHIPWFSPMTTCCLLYITLLQFTLSQAQLTLTSVFRLFSTPSFLLKFGFPFLSPFPDTHILFVNFSLNLSIYPYRLSTPSSTLSQPYYHYYTTLLPYDLFVQLSSHHILSSILHFQHIHFCTYSSIGHGSHPYNSVGTTMPSNMPIFALPDINISFQTFIIVPRTFATHSPYDFHCQGSICCYVQSQVFETLYFLRVFSI